MEVHAEDATVYFIQYYEYCHSYSNELLSAKQLTTILLQPYKYLKLLRIVLQDG